LKQAVSDLKRQAAQDRKALAAEFDPDDLGRVEGDLLLRWINAVCRVLMHVQNYHHGGGVLILPHESLDGLDVKYRIRYDRLLPALVGLVRAELGRSHPDHDGALLRIDPPHDVLPFVAPPAPRGLEAALEQHKNEMLGTIRFIASLTCVDGVVLLDKSLVVRGFGVEVRSDTRLNEIFIAGDSAASPARLRKGEITQFGTRHRAIMRYCYQHPGALGFAVSQDGNLQVVTRIDERLVLWENVDVQLAFKAEGQVAAGLERAVVLRRFTARVE